MQTVYVRAALNLNQNKFYYRYEIQILTPSDFTHGGPGGGVSIH